MGGGGDCNFMYNVLSRFSELELGVECPFQSKRSTRRKYPTPTSSRK